MDRNTIFKTNSLIALTAALVMAAAWAVGATGWTDGLNAVAFVGFGAIVIGLLLARSRLPGVIAHLFSLIIGAAWSFWLTARLLPVHYTWLERRADLLYRLTRWYNQAMQGGISRDNLMFILQMSLIVWAMGYLTLWFLFRSRRVWPAIIPPGLVLIINLYYAPKDITFWFLIYLLLSLLLVIRFNLFNQQTHWRRARVFFQTDISFDFLRDGLIFAVLVISLAWLTPPLAFDSPGLLRDFQGAWHDWQSEWNRLYAALNYRPTDALGGFGPALSLGGPRRLNKEPVMDVAVVGPGRYWRATVYDEYTGQEWRNTDQDSAPFGQQVKLALPAFMARRTITQTYMFYHDSVALYTLNNPVSLDRTAKATFNAVAPEYSLASRWPTWPPSTGPWPEEITYLRSNAAVNKGETYRVVSLVSQATVEQLQQAGKDYPLWVKLRYLKLPGSVTERTRQLAFEITMPFTNTFDKAQAVETYLRAHIKYNELIVPPANIDRVDYVLFEDSQGYCDYYASAMVVLLRAVGIPARMAVGYAQGQSDAQRNVYHVLNADAHAWVEVYFSRYGWVEFEPTAAQPTIIRPVPPKDDTNADPNRPDFEYEDEGRFPGQPDNIPEDELLGGGGLPLTFNLSLFGAQISLPRAVVNTGLTVLGVAAALALVAAGYWWRQQQLKAAQNIVYLYQTMVSLAGWLGARRRPWQTPYEHAALLQSYLPPYRREIETITAEYVRQTFGPAAKSESITTDTALAWRRLRPEMLKAAIKRRLPWRR